MTTDRQRIRHLIDMAERLSALRLSVDEDVERLRGLRADCRELAQLAEGLVDNEVVAPLMSKLEAIERKCAQLEVRIGEGCAERDSVQESVVELCAVVLPAMQVRAARQTYWATVVLAFFTFALIIATIGAALLARGAT